MIIRINITYQIPAAFQWISFNSTMLNVTSYEKTLMVTLTGPGVELEPQYETTHQTKMNS